MEPAAPCVPQVDGETAEQLFRSGPCRLMVTVSPIGVVEEQARIQGRIIRLQLQWADRSRRPPRSLITDITQCVPQTVLNNGDAVGRSTPGGIGEFARRASGMGSARCRGGSRISPYLRAGPG